MRLPAWRDAKMQRVPSRYVFALVEADDGPVVLTIKRTKHGYVYVNRHDVQDFDVEMPPWRIVMWRRPAKGE